MAVPGTAQILDGKKVAEAVRSEVRAATGILVEQGVQPGLGVVLVGDDPASQVYVRNKDRAALEVGFRVETIHLPAEAAEEEVIARVSGLASDQLVHGILVQLPLPRGMNAARVLRTIPPQKDVDGLHPQNLAALLAGEPGLVPCTPAGCIELLDRHGQSLRGCDVCVIGRSLLVGKPFALLALSRDASVTICHSKTRDLRDHCRRADVILAAVGVPRLVRGDWVKPGAVVVDVGINRLPEGRLVGDVAFEEVLEVAGALTPVPGGVGPMTIAMLLFNTALAASRQNGIHLEMQLGPPK